MENGGSNLERQFAGLTVGDPRNNGNDGLFQVMKAVQAAEATIKQQVEENNRLRYELQKRNEELEEYKSGDGKHPNHHLGDQWGDHVDDTRRTDQIVLHLGDHIGGVGNADTNSGHGLPNSAVLRTNMVQSNKGHATQTHPENQLDRSKVNGSSNVVNSSWVASGNSGSSQFVSPSASIALSTPTRYHQEGDLDLEFRHSGRGSISVAEANNTSSSKQIREREEEIFQYKRHLAELSIKEAQISNEKCALDKRISYMRLAFDQQQQDLVNAASKAISYRQDIMEENVRLTYALQAAQEERSTFVTSLTPLLAEYSLQPPAGDAQSIVSNVKVLFRHLQEQLLVIEGKLKESQYQLAHWRSESNPSKFSHSPDHPDEIRNGLELVLQPKFSDGKMRSSDPQSSMAGDILGLPQSGMDNLSNFEHDDLGKHSPTASRNTESYEVPSKLVFSQAEPHLACNNEVTVGKKVTFGGLVRSSDIDGPENRGRQSDRESLVNWNSKASATTSDDPNSSYSPYLPPVLEEPSSSFSEEDVPLPAIEGLQISGEPFPGQQLQACGYSINGTTICNFEWVRHMDDGSFIYVDGANQPNYLVTADDVDTCLAIEVQPLDDRKRKGEPEVVFANERRKITCDPVMQNCIEMTLDAGHASYTLSLSTGYLMWEPAILTIKREAYSIKCSGLRGVAVSKKFSPSTFVSIPLGSPTEFFIADSMGVESLLMVDSVTDVSCSRDTIVLILRSFILKAVERKTRKKKGLLFNK